MLLFLWAVPVTATAPEPVARTVVSDSLLQAPTVPLEAPAEGIRAYAIRKATEAAVDPATVLSVISCESGWNPKAIGDHGESFGLVQIHLVAHPGITRTKAEDPYFAIDFLVKNLKAGKGSMWTCFNKISYAQVYTIS